MSLFKKSNRKSQKSNQRIRLDDSDDDIKESFASHLPPIKPIVKIQPTLELNNENSDKSNDKFDYNLDVKSETKGITNPKLSFADIEEDENDVFKVKKSSYSRRMANQKEMPKKKRDNKKDVKISDDRNTVDENLDKNSDDLNVIWIKSKEIKEEPKCEPEMKIFSGDQIESDSEYEDEPEEYKSNEPFHHFRGALERGVIPDAKTIYELKKQRQMARDIDDLIIPLADDDSESRVIRDDDNDRSDDDDEDERISFAINRDNIERQKAREAFLMAQEEKHDLSGSESESDDELDRWEREQIKKGVRMPVIQMLNQEQASNRAISGYFNDNRNVVDMDIDRPFRHKKSQSIPSRVLNKSKISVTMEDIIERINNELKVNKETLEGNQRQIVTLRAKANESQKEIERLAQKRQELIDRVKCIDSTSDDQ